MATAERDSGWLALIGVPPSRAKAGAARRRRPGRRRTGTRMRQWVRAGGGEGKRSLLLVLEGRSDVTSFYIGTKACAANAAIITAISRKL
jgi:hypothetical protein